MNELKEEQTPQKKKFNWGRFWFWMISLLIIGILIGIAIPNMIYMRVTPIPDSCSGNLRNLGIIITNYSTDHKGHYPQNLGILEELGYVESLPTCPSSDKNYIYMVNGWNSPDFTVWCPNPEEHVGSSGPKSVTASLYYHSGEGVNQVDK